LHPHGNKLCPSFSRSFAISDEAEFLQKLTPRNTEDKTINLTSRYIDDVLSINNSTFANWIPLIYPKGSNRKIFLASFL